MIKLHQLHTALGRWTDLAFRATHYVYGKRICFNSWTETTGRSVMFRPQHISHKPSRRSPGTTHSHGSCQISHFKWSMLKKRCENIKRNNFHLELMIKLVTPSLSNLCPSEHGDPTPLELTCFPPAGYNYLNPSCTDSVRKSPVRLVGQHFENTVPSELLHQFEWLAAVQRSQGKRSLKYNLCNISGVCPNA